MFNTDLASEARAIFLDFTCVDRTIIEGWPYPGNFFLLNEFSVGCKMYLIFYTISSEKVKCTK